MKKSLTILCIVFLVFILNACSIRHGDFTVLSNKLVNLTDFELGKTDRAKGVEGEDVQNIILFIPTSGPPTLEGALDNALEKGNGDIMTDAVISWRYFYLPLIFGQQAWEVKGDVVRTRK